MSDQKNIAEGGEAKYWAFISYSTIDKNWADWLHSSLERYIVPKKLVGKKTSIGLVPKRLFPVFRDRSELPSSTDLGGNLRIALQRSRALIVICSPRSAISRWVNEELLTFIQLGRPDRIFPLIVAGEPGASDGKRGFQISDECFAPALRYGTDAAGAFTVKRPEPLAADLRSGKDGRNNAKLKLISGILGLDFDELKRRDIIRRRKRVAAAVLSAFALLIAVGSIWKYQQVVDEQRLTEQKGRQKKIEVQTRAEQDLLNGDALSALKDLQEVPDSFRHFAQIPRLTGLTLRGIQGLRWVFDQPADVIRRVAVGKSGEVLSVLSERGVARLIDLRTGKTLREFVGQGVLQNVDTKFSASGQSFLYFSNQGATVYNLKDRSTVNLEFDLRNELPTSCVFDGEQDNVATTHLFQGSQGTMTKVTIWEIPAGKRGVEQVLTGIYHLLAYSSARSRIVVIGGDFRNGKMISFEILILDSNTGKTVSEIPLENLGLQAFAHVSGDGSRAIVPVGQGTKLSLAVYDLTTGQQLFPLSARDRAEWVGPSGTTILSLQDDGSFNLCDGASGEPTLKLEPGQFSSITLSHTGKYLATVSNDGEVSIRDGHSGQLLKHFEDRIGWEKPFAMGAGTDDLAFALDDTELVIANGRSHLVRIWAWQETSSTRTTIQKRSGAVTNGAFVSDGSLLFTSSDDGYAGTCQSSDGREVVQFKDAGLGSKWKVSQAIFGADGTCLLAGLHSPEATLWNAESGALIARLHLAGTDAESCNSIFADASPDGKRFLTVCASGVGAIWDRKSLTEQTKFLVPVKNAVRQAFFSLDGSQFFVATVIGQLCRCDAKTGAVEVSFGEPCKDVAAILPSVDGRSLFVDDRFRGVTLYDVSGTLQKVYAYKTFQVNDVREIPGTKLLAFACTDDRVRIIDTISGEFRNVLAEKKVEAEDIFGGPSIIPFAPNSRPLYGFIHVAIAPDGSLVAAANTDGKICIWDTTSGEQVARFSSHGIYPTLVTWLTFDKSSQRLVNGNEDGSCFVWSLKPEEVSAAKISDLLHHILRDIP